MCLSASLYKMETILDIVDTTRWMKISDLSLECEQSIKCCLWIMSYLLGFIRNQCSQYLGNYLVLHTVDTQ